MEAAAGGIRLRLFVEVHPTGGRGAYRRGDPSGRRRRERVLCGYLAGRRASRLAGWQSALLADFASPLAMVRVMAALSVSSRLLLSTARRHPAPRYCRRPMGCAAAATLPTAAENRAL